jgi:hypothetical protein
MPDVPPARSDRSLIIVTGIFVVVAGLLFTAVLFLATGGDTATGKPAPIFIGAEQGLIDNINEDGPRYFAHPFGGDGFWLDVEDGGLVALVLDAPGSQRCTVKWRDPRNAYIDCRGNPIDPGNLDRYPVIVGARAGSPDDSVYVDIRTVDPAPGAGGSTG